MSLIRDTLTLVLLEESADEEYVLSSHNHMFEDAHWCVQDILFWAGLLEGQTYNDALEDPEFKGYVIIRAQGLCPAMAVLATESETPEVVVNALDGYARYAVDTSSPDGARLLELMRSMRKEGLSS